MVILFVLGMFIDWVGILLLTVPIFLPIMKSLEWGGLFGLPGVRPEDVSQVLLAGSFGAYLTPLSAVRIGLVPKIALPRIVSAGNVAGEGAKIAALSVRERAEAHSILREVEYVELSGRADFNDMFVDKLAFPG